MKCTFCSITIRPGAGKLFVRKDGSILTFCSRKCEKNLLQLKKKITHNEVDTKIPR